MVEKLPPVLSIVLPCYKRPQRTLRMIDCVAAQDFGPYEIFITGDGCPDFAAMAESTYFKNKMYEIVSKGNTVHVENLDHNYGGHGYEAINRAIAAAQGTYFLFLSNDDTIAPNHFSHYKDAIENISKLHEVDYNFVFFNSQVYVPGKDETRWSNITMGGIGHSELIIKTAFLKSMPPHSANYGHDWELVQNMEKHGRFRKSISLERTYQIRSMPGYTEPGID